MHITTGRNPLLLFLNVNCSNVLAAGNLAFHTMPAWHTLLDKMPMLMPCMLFLNLTIKLLDSSTPKSFQMRRMACIAGTLDHVL